MAIIPANYPPRAIDFFVVSVSCSTSTSAAAAGVGPFKGLFFKASSSISIVGRGGNTIDLNDVPRNTILWIEGVFVSAIVTATVQFGLL